MRSNRNIYGVTSSPLHALAAELKTPSVEIDVGLFLRFFCKTAKPKKILEIGCGIGVSTRYMAEAAPDAEITALDHNHVRLAQAKKIAGGIENITFVQSEGVEFMRNSAEKYDLIFIDSVKKDYPVMYHYAEQLLTDSGAVIMDDVFCYGYIFCEDCEIPEKYRALAGVFRDFLHRIKNTRDHSVLPIGGGVLVTYRG
ncbi:MAG: O-methyltransferase [Deferribacterales bacterium]